MRALLTSSDAVVLLGAALLAGSLIPVWRLVSKVPQGVARWRWRSMGAMIVSVIVGYLTYAFRADAGPARLADLLVPMVFFLGACIVLVVCLMSLQTVEDVCRVALLERQSLTDPLTEAYNRRYMDDRLRREVARAHRCGAALSVLSVDVDGFKRVNDTWGHEVGDEALKAVGRLGAAAVRAQDVFARYGGDEFVVLAPDTTLAGAEVLAERLRRLIFDGVLAVVGKGTSQQEVRLTVSIGVAALRPAPDDAQGLMARADAAMYLSKREGRNRTTLSREA
jgi:diguanylate cyclase (GGDEF)-like protein